MRGWVALTAVALGSAGCAANVLSVGALDKPDRAADDVAAALTAAGWDCKANKSEKAHGVGCTKKGRVVGVAFEGKGDEAVVMFLTLIQQPLCNEPAFAERVAAFNATATLGKADCNKDTLLLHRAFFATSVGYSRKEIAGVLESWHDAIIGNAQKRGLLDDKLGPPGDGKPGTPGTPGGGKVPDGNQI